MTRRSTDFESVASASSAIPAKGGSSILHDSAMRPRGHSVGQSPCLLPSSAVTLVIFCAVRGLVSLWCAKFYDPGSSDSAGAPPLSTRRLRSSHPRLDPGFCRIRCLDGTLLQPQRQRLRRTCGWNARDGQDSGSRISARTLEPHGAVPGRSGTRQRQHARLQVRRALRHAACLHFQTLPRVLNPVAMSITPSGCAGA